MSRHRPVSPCMPTTAPSSAATRKQAVPVAQKATVIPTGPGGIPLSRLPPLEAELTRVLISDLFPALLKKQAPAFKSVDSQVVWSLKCPDLEADVARGVYQAYAQTRRRSERLPIETAEFAQAEKSRHAEQIRRTYRSGASFQSIGSCAQTTFIDLVGATYDSGH